MEIHMAASETKLRRYTGSRLPVLHFIVSSRSYTFGSTPLPHQFSLSSTPKFQFENLQKTVDFGGLYNPRRQSFQRTSWSSRNPRRAIGCERSYRRRAPSRFQGWHRLPLCDPGLTQMGYVACLYRIFWV